MAELDQQLSVESARARDLKLSAHTSAKKRKDIKTEIDVLIREICEREMEAEDLACIYPRHHSSCKKVAQHDLSGCCEGGDSGEGFRQ